MYGTYLAVAFMNAGLYGLETAGPFPLDDRNCHSQALSLFSLNKGRFVTLLGGDVFKVPLSKWGSMS